MEKKDRYGIYLGNLPGNTPKVSAIMVWAMILDTFGIYLWKTPKIDPKNGVKFGTQGVGDIDILNQLCYPFSRMLGIEKSKVTQLIYYAYMSLFWGILNGSAAIFSIKYKKG